MQAQLNQGLVIQHFLHIYMQQVCGLKYVYEKEVRLLYDRFISVQPDVTSNDAA